jgi:DUF4097 and DUF4098 domain-containing protein YvlB
VRKEIRVVSGNGRVTVADIGGPAYIKTSFGLVEATRVEGGLTVENSNGAVRASDVKGPASVRTSFGAVSLEGVGGAVDVDSQNGSVELRRLTGKDCQKVSLKTSFALIRLALPEGSGYAVTARTSFGKISSEIPVTASGQLSEGSLTGKIGDGNCELTLTNNNGNIEITR